MKCILKNLKTIDVTGLIDLFSTMIGTGFTPEGLTDSYITTELMSEMSWRTEPVGNISKWIEHYCKRRYGKTNDDATKAWIQLSENVLNSNSDHFNQKVLMTLTPRLDRTDFTWYPFSDVVTALDYLVKAAPDLQDEPGFQ